MVPLQIVDLADQPEGIGEQTARMLVEQFDAPAGWPNLAAARDEVSHILCVGFARAALEGDEVIGWVGGLPEYDGRVWELHPLVVRRERRRQGVGRALVAAFETEAVRRGALTLTLGTDDDSGMTSLSGVDLYDSLPRHLSELRDLGREHPFQFYQKLGYTVTGVMPDASGPGLPDIYLSKRAKLEGDLGQRTTIATT